MRPPSSKPAFSRQSTCRTCPSREVGQSAAHTTLVVFRSQRLLSGPELREPPQTAWAGRDSPMLLPMLGQLRVERVGPGRPRVRPDALRADKAYSSRAICAHLREHGIVAERA